MKRPEYPKPPKGRKLTPIERRVAACNATMKRYQGKLFSFRRDRDCARLVHFHAGKLGKRVNVGKAGKYATPAEALAALRKLGFEDLPALMDARFKRIGHASALPGDIIQMPAEPGELSEIGCLAVWLGDGAAFGFHGETGRAEPMKLITDPLAAWSLL